MMFLSFCIRVEVVNSIDHQSEIILVWNIWNKNYLLNNFVKYISLQMFWSTKNTRMKNKLSRKQLYSKLAITFGKPYYLAFNKGH